MVENVYFQFLVIESDDIETRTTEMQVYATHTECNCFHRHSIQKQMNCLEDALNILESKVIAVYSMCS